MHHGQAQKAPANFTPGADHLTHSQCFLLRRIEAEKPQHTGVCAVVNGHQQLPAGTQLHFGGGDSGFDLNRITLAGLFQFDDARFVLVAQRNVQGQIDVTHQTHFAHRFLRRRQGFGR